MAIRKLTAAMHLLLASATVFMLTIVAPAKCPGEENLGRGQANSTRKHA